MIKISIVIGTIALCVITYSLGYLDGMASKNKELISLEQAKQIHDWYEELNLVP